MPPELYWARVVSNLCESTRSKNSAKNSMLSVRARLVLERMKPRYSVNESLCNGEVGIVVLDAAVCSFVVVVLITY